MTRETTEAELEKKIPEHRIRRALDKRKEVRSTLRRKLERNQRSMRRAAVKLFKKSTKKAARGGWEDGGPEFFRKKSYGQKNVS